MPDQAWESMFEQATAFNEPIGDWNTASVSDTRIPVPQQCIGDFRVHAAPRMESHQACTACADR